MFQNKIALVTGASKGIGVYICKTLANNGIKIAAIARNKTGLEKTKLEINNNSGDIEIFPFDLTKINQIPALIKDITKKMGSPSILINNAGIEKYNLFQNYTDNDIETIFTTNLLAPITLTKELLPEMLITGGSIVNISSLAGKKGVVYNSLYSATKSGLLMWSDAMRQELKDTNVSFSVVCPGFISDKGMFAETKLKAPPLLGTSKPQKVADAVLLAVNSENGKEIIVNKGPIRPLLAFAQLFPQYGDKITEFFGVKKLNRKRFKL